MIVLLVYKTFAEARKKKSYKSIYVKCGNIVKQTAWR